MNILTFVLFCLLGCNLSLAEFKYKTILDHDNRVRLEWNITEFKQEKYVIFKLILFPNRLPLIFGFGMSDRGEFKNADFLVFDLGYDEIKFADSYTNSEGILRKDLKSNYLILNYEIKEPLRLEITFERKLDTCDQKDYLIESGTVHLVHFLLNKRQLYPNLRSLFAKKFRPWTDADLVDMKQSQLIRSTYFEDKIKSFDPQTARYFDIRNKNIKLPAEDTTYWCLAFRLDEKFIEKHHIVAFESLITNTSQGVVHHMELFHCIFDPPDQMKNYNGPCKSEEKPAGLTQCRKVIAAWAMGAERFVYPDQVGGVIGGKDFSPYVVLEVHYDNPKLKDNIIDSLE